MCFLSLFLDNPNLGSFCLQPARFVSPWLRVLFATSRLPRTFLSFWWSEDAVEWIILDDWVIPNQSKPVINWVIQLSIMIQLQFIHVYHNVIHLFDGWQAQRNSRLHRQREALLELQVTRQDPWTVWELYYVSQLHGVLWQNARHHQHIRSTDQYDDSILSLSRWRFGLRPWFWMCFRWVLSVLFFFWMDF